MQLIDVETGAQLWADRFETDHSAVAKARDEIIGRLQRSLSRKLIEDVSRRIEALPSGEWSVYDLNMRGRVFMMRPQSIANCRAAMNSFEQALQRDPGSDAARIGIANVLIGDILDNWTTSIAADAARAEQLLLQVLQGDSDVCEAHASMGKLRRIQGRLRDSRLELEMAIAMSPNFHIAIGQLGMTLAFLGEPEAAIPWIEKSLRLGSHDSLTSLDQGKMGLCYLLLGDSDSAVTWLRKARAGNMRMYYTHMWLAAGLGLRGELDEARASVREAIEIAPDMCSLVALRARWRMMTSSPRFFALAEKTLVAGLRRAGLPEGE